MTAREWHPTANGERAQVRMLHVCLAPFEAFLRTFRTGTHDLSVQIQPPKPRLRLLHRTGHTVYPNSRRLANSIRNT